MARTAAQPAGISRIARGALKKCLVFEDEYSMYNSRYYSGVLLKEGFGVFFVCFPRLLQYTLLKNLPDVHKQQESHKGIFVASHVYTCWTGFLRAY